MEENVNVEEQQYGKVSFANDVLATIAGIAACDIKGVAGMSGGLKDGFVDFIGKKNLAKGVKVTETDGVVTVDIQIVIEYGAIIPDVCNEMQENVTKALETMTGLKVDSVNIAVQGIKFKEVAAPVEEETEEN